MTTMREKRVWKLVGAAVVAVALTACPEPGAGPDDRTVDADRNGMQMDGMQGMDMDHGAMQRHAEELDEATDRMRAHLQEIGSAPPAEWPERVDGHVREVSGFLSLMRRQMREMDMGMGMDHEHMGEMMGMGAHEHHQMMEDMEALRAELESLQVASPAEVRDQMPEHLYRLERVVGMAEQSAEHMGSM